MDSFIEPFEILAASLFDMLTEFFVKESYKVDITNLWALGRFNVYLETSGWEGSR